MSDADALQNLWSSVGGNRGEPVPEADPEELKAIWQRTRDLQARHPHRQSGGRAFAQNVAADFEAMKACCKPGANAQAVLYRSILIWAAIRFAPGLFAPWVKDEQVSDAVFRTTATIPMKWVGPPPQEDLPYDVEEFFRRLREGSAQNN